MRFSLKRLQLAVAFACLSASSVKVFRDFVNTQFLVGFLSFWFAIALGGAALGVVFCKRAWAGSLAGAAAAVGLGIIIPALLPSVSKP
jgi:hypothetical protein